MDDIDLQSLVNAVREQLKFMAVDRRERGIAFEVESVDLELKVGVVRTTGGSAGFALQVLTLGASKSTAEERVHTVRIKLIPREDETDGRVRVGS